MRYTHIFNGEDGSSRFDGGEVTFTDQVFAPPAPPLGVSEATPVGQMMFIEFPAGWTDAAHPSPARQWMFVLSGRGEVSAGGDTQQWGPGDVFFLEDTEGPGHATTVHERAVLAVVRC
jgi:quercetin dioxygenase-like cupin family protein